MDTRTETLKISLYDLKYLKRKGRGNAYKGFKAYLVTSNQCTTSKADKIDRVAAFINECTTKSKSFVSVSLFDLYETYCQYETPDALGKILFSKSLRQLGYEVRHAAGNQVRVYGIEMIIDGSSFIEDDLDEDEDW